MSRHLPQRANLEFLRNQAKDLLPILQQRHPLAKLADAQHAIAVDYGFSNWSSLKTHVEGLTHESPLIGTWTLDRARSRQRPDAPFRRASVAFAVLADTVTITDVVQDASGHEERNVTTIRADGQEHASEHGYDVTASWRGAHMLEMVVMKDGKEVSRLTYEVSRDGDTLTLSAIAAAHAGYPAVQQLSVFTRTGRALEMR